MRRGTSRALRILIHGQVEALTERQDSVLPIWATPLPATEGEDIWRQLRSSRPSRIELPLGSLAVLTKKKRCFYVYWLAAIPSSRCSLEVCACEALGTSDLLCRDRPLAEPNVQQMNRSTLTGIETLSSQRIAVEDYIPHRAVAMPPTIEGAGHAAVFTGG